MISDKNSRKIPKECHKAPACVPPGTGVSIWIPGSGSVDPTTRFQQESEAESSFHKASRCVPAIASIRAPCLRWMRLHLHRPRIPAGVPPAGPEETTRLGVGPVFFPPWRDWHAIVSEICFEPRAKSMDNREPEPCAPCLLSEGGEAATPVVHKESVPLKSVVRRKPGRST